MASASQESSSGSSISSVSLSAGECGGAKLGEVERHTGLSLEITETLDCGEVTDVGLWSTDEAGELNEVDSDVVAQVGADTGIGRFDGGPVFLALVGLEVPFFSFESM